MQLQTQERTSRARKPRIPLDHPECDNLDLRIRNLFLDAELTELEAGTLLKRRRELREADRFLARIMRGRPLPMTDCRPSFWDDWVADPAQVAVAAGWVFRLLEYVEKIERKHFPALYGTLDVVAGDDI